jgi:hypothetical protein
MRRLLIGCTLALACSHGPRDEWRSFNDRHADAAQELCAWSAQHPKASDRILDWESRNPARAQVLLEWAVRNPGFGWEHFVAQHPEFQDFAAMASQHPRAANQQLDWARRHPDAASDLVSHPGAERFAGKRTAC